MAEDRSEAAGRHPATPAAQTQSFNRKYRPGSFSPDELVGQEHVAQTLRHAIMLDRVAQAYLFCGPRGTGKTTMARLLAKAVNCLDPDPANRPCNHCDACRAINEGSAVDIIEIDAASNRGVDDIRDLREKVKYAPSSLRVKFYIIDEAHQLTRDAFNAFLKTLEEPPAHVRFVLATTEPDKLPETVASRCQRFDFRRHRLEDTVFRLRTICDQEGIEAEDEALLLIARQATGSMRDALGLLEQLALFADPVDGKPRITAESVRQVVGLSRTDRLSALVDALLKRDVAAGLAAIGAASDAGEDIHQLNRQLVAYLRGLLLIRAGGSPDEAGAEAQQQAQGFELPELARLVSLFSAIEGTLNKTSFGQLPLELALVEGILALQGRQLVPVTLKPAEPAPATSRETPPPAPPRTRPAPEVNDSRRAPAPRDDATIDADDERRSASAPPPSPVPVPDASTQRTPSPPARSVPAGDEATLERLVGVWRQVCRDVKLANSRASALLLSADPASIQGDQIILTSAYPFHRERLNEASARDPIEAVISQYLGGNFRVSCVAPEELSVVVRAASARAATPPTPATSNGSGSLNEPAASFDAELELPAESGPDEFDEPAPGLDVDAIQSPRSDHRVEFEEQIRAAKVIFDATEVEPDDDAG
ncbi:MAG TPA: DNA polymerase III subunit gamma/tau [Thermomicrobiaceae bacterium]|nr:DNA polymerase III subunit gamma/tau [Thermomicrobiaceae bacterium]